MPKQPNGTPGKKTHALDRMASASRIAEMREVTAKSTLLYNSRYAERKKTGVN